MKTIKQMLKYGMVGLMNTGITLSIIFILMNWLNVSYRISNVSGYIVGFFNSFLWNKHWTFQSKGKVTKELILFLLVFLFCYGLQFLLLILLVERWRLSENVSQLFSMAFYTLVGFILNKLVTFKSSTTV